MILTFFNKNYYMDHSRIINLPFDQNNGKKIESTKKEKKERVIVNKEKWDFDEIINDPICQNRILCNKDDENVKCHEKMIQQINRKINSYKQQDKTKNLFNPEKIIKCDQVIELLKSCESICYYCKELVHILYKNVRESKQWTLERIDNDFGHNHDNVVISCLECNLHRRTMYHERYVFTKQLVIKKI